MTAVMSAFSKKLHFCLFTLNKMRFQIYPLWRAFSKSSVFSVQKHHFSVDRRPNRIKKVAFSNLSGLPLHQESGQKPGKPGKARPGQACRAFGRACQKSTAWKSQSSPAKAVLLWPPWQPNLGKPGLGRTFGATMATKARLSRACKFDARISWLSWSVTY